MKNSFAYHVSQMLQLGKKIIKTNPLLAEETGSTNIKGDKTIGMDKKMEDVLIDYIKKNNLPADIFSEEIGMNKFHPNPTHLIVFDPLDGSTNYKLGKNLLPYGLLIACYRGLRPKLKDIVASGSMEHTTNLGWIYDGKVTRDLKGKILKFKKDWIINRSTPVYFDLYYKKAYNTFAPLAEKIHIRWAGSNVGSLTFVLSEVAAVMGNYQMRPEEIGAVFSLIKGAGGIIVSHQGEDLGEEYFSIDKTYKIFAGDTKVIRYMVQQLHSHSER